MKNPVKLIASVFYLGYAPLMPGTVGSAAAVILYLLFRGNFGLYTFLLLAVTALGFRVCGPAEKAFRQKDSKKIVIDEVAGLLLSFWGLASLNTTWIIIGFFLFRFLDMVKIYPACRLEKVEGSIGIMGDDLVAGFYTNVILQILTRVF